MTRIGVIYYSATGNVHALARAVAQGAADEGADVRLRPVAELPPEMQISFKQRWGRHRTDLEDQPNASLEDLEWADGIAFGTPTRFGNVAAQLKAFLDLAGELWERGVLVDKVATSFTASQTEHGGQESTILALNNTFYHWGAIVLPLGYTVHEAFNGGGNLRRVVHERPPCRRAAGRDDALGGTRPGRSPRTCHGGDRGGTRGRPPHSKSGHQNQSIERKVVGNTARHDEQPVEPMAQAQPMEPMQATSRPRWRLLDRSFINRLHAAAAASSSRHHKGAAE